MAEKLTIANWAEEDKPREKLERLGASALSNAELLGILIGSGSTDESAVDLMKRILKDCDNNLNQLGKKTIRELTQYKGMGPAKAITILAACELGKRRQEEHVEERPSAQSSEDIYRYFLNKLRDNPVEECHVLLMNHNLRIIGSVCVSRGGITGTVVDVRLVLREAILANATSIALCHNHPSGSSKPSREDDRLTQRVKEAAKAMDIRFIDHIVLADGSYYSYNDEGRL